jgi:transcriptional regulator with XRE-family HTH domain
MSLKSLRKSLRMTQAEVADRLDVSQAAVSLYEAGRPIPESRLPLIAGVLNCNPEDLVTDPSARRRKRVRACADPNDRWCQTIGYFAAQAKLTGEEIAQRSGVAKARVAAMLRGELPVLGDEAKALASVLNCRAADIVSGEPGTAVSGNALFEVHDMGGHPIPGEELTDEARERALYELGLRNTPAAVAPKLKHGRYPAGAAVATYRRALGWSQKQLADRADISQPAISAIETGSAPLQRAVWRALAAGFGVLPECLGSGEWHEAA